MPRAIRKAVLPAAGWGTRFLPATKAQPKEMLALVDKPIIQYAVEEAVAADITHITIITAGGKRAIEDHFDRSFELENALEQKGLKEQLDDIRRISALAEVCYIRQQEQLGLGHAVLVARELVGDQPFAVILSDDIIVSDSASCIGQMVPIFQRYGASVVAVERLPKEDLSSYGVVAVTPVGERLYRVTGLVEKPDPEYAPSNLGIVGRYILTPTIFSALERTQRGRGGEIQLTDALQLLLEREPVYAYEFVGKRYDAGNKLGFLRATVELALQSPDLGPAFRQYLISLNLDQHSPGV
ncbi:MAG: UTP--glucose-1-phosphate uridylyltransferase GalU [Chloroflexi bacterium]|nr:UTP--glucose-1-phosphate uridylyltransferase GalU [Chloroflexota bacterium]